jgi:hypothetical protein
VGGAQFGFFVPLTFTLATSFGSGISTTGTPPFSSITLQPGIYQIHLDGAQFVFQAGSGIQAFLNDAELSPNFWSSNADFMGPGNADIIGGDRLVQVTQANSSLKLY